jgi:hypothetical protein
MPATVIKLGILSFQTLVDVCFNAGDHSESKDLIIAWITNLHC